MRIAFAHSFGLRSRPSLCHNHGEHGALGRLCPWRDLRAAGDGGQAIGYRQECPQEGRCAARAWRGRSVLAGTRVAGRVCTHVCGSQRLGQDVAHVAPSVPRTCRESTFMACFQALVLPQGLGKDSPLACSSVSAIRKGIAGAHGSPRKSHIAKLSAKHRKTPVRRRRTREISVRRWSLTNN